ncbi:MAG: adenosylcobinamide-GDP ribazoletransferase, partial [Actinophytocola sp.]|nr:adenosylcobinamide-GDP ribazoletransferase [Actinophytocola sp.]
AGRAGLDRREAARALLWLPAVGALLGAVAAGVLLAVQAVADGAAGRLLAAVLAIGTVAALTGALHLDGLADTADGLGSRRPAPQALEIMRRSDIGPIGVVTLVFAIAVQVVALATLPAGGYGAVALVLAAVAGRVAVVLSAGVRGARSDGFGALVAGSVRRPAQYGWVAGLLALTAAPAALGQPVVAARLFAASALALAAGWLLCRHLARRLGGMTGDGYGAVAETTATVVLLVLALTA